AELLQPAGRDVAGDERVGYAGEAARAQVHVGAADLAELDVEQRGVRLEVRLRELAHLGGEAGRGDDGGADGWHAAMIGPRQGPRPVRGWRDGGRRTALPQPDRQLGAEVEHPAPPPHLALAHLRAADDPGVLPLLFEDDVRRAEQQDVDARDELYARSEAQPGSAEEERDAAIRFNAGAGGDAKERQWGWSEPRLHVERADAIAPQLVFVRAMAMDP